MTKDQSLKITEHQIESFKNQLKELSLDFKEGQWVIPASKVQQRQKDVRQTKFQIRAAEESFRARFGTPPEVRNLLPLVLRREFLQVFKVTAQNIPRGPYEVPEGYSIGFTYQPDGELFSFAPLSFIDVEQEQCGCGFDNPEQQTESERVKHLGECPQIIIAKEKTQLWQSSHSRGNWECRACLRSAPTSQDEQPVGFNPEKVIRWCPKFLLDIAGIGPVQYAIEFRRMNPDVKVCYAGLLHSQLNVSETHAELMYLCDTCGYSYSEKKEVAQAVPSGTVLVDLSNDPSEKQQTENRSSMR